MSKKRLAKVQVILIALVVAMTGCHHKEEQQLPIVIVDKPSKEDVQIYGEYVGRIRLPPDASGWDTAWIPTPRCRRIPPR